MGGEQVWGLSDYLVQDRGRHQVPGQVPAGLEQRVKRLHGRESVRQEAAEGIDLAAALEVEAIAAAEDVIGLAVVGDDDGRLRKGTEEDLGDGRVVPGALVDEPQPEAAAGRGVLANVGHVAHQPGLGAMVEGDARQRAGVRLLDQQIDGDGYEGAQHCRERLGVLEQLEGHGGLGKVVGRHHDGIIFFCYLHRGRRMPPTTQ